MNKLQKIALAAMTLTWATTAITVSIGIKMDEKYNEHVMTIEDPIVAGMVNEDGTGKISIYEKYEYNGYPHVTYGRATQNIEYIVDNDVNNENDVPLAIIMANSYGEERITLKVKDLNELKEIPTQGRYMDEIKLRQHVKQIKNQKLDLYNLKAEKVLEEEHQNPDNDFL